MEVLFSYKSKKGYVSINIPFECQTRVREKDGVVVMTAYPNGDEAFRVVERVFFNMDPDVPLSAIVNEESRLFESMVLAERYRVVARCHQQDTFDALTGVRVAERKLRAKLENAVRERVHMFRKHLEGAVERLKDIEKVE